MRASRRQWLVPVVGIGLWVLLVNPLAGQTIRTASEAGGFKAYTNFEQMWDFLQEVQAHSTEMLLSDYGVTVEGRREPYVILSRPLVTQPWEALVSGKPIVLLAANVHGGERTVRESLLMLTRDLAEPNHPVNKLLDKLVIIVVPSINPDGFARSSRGDALGIDMNRDYIKLEQPSLADFVQKVWLPWQPHVVLDGHNGCSFPYNICYQGPAHAGSDQRLTDLCDREIFPFVDKQMEAGGYKSWYYSGGNRTAWQAGLTDVRVNNNYGGFLNSISILYESPSQAPDVGAKSGYVASLALLEFTAQNADKVMMYVNRARRETIEMGQKAQGDIPVQVTKGPKPYKVSYLIAEGTGADRKIVQVTGADLIAEPVVTKTRPRPYAYVLEPRAFRAVALLRKHNITVEVLQKETELPVEAYQMTKLERKPQYDHPATVTVTCADETVKQTRTFPKGSFVIRTGQAQGRLVTQLLEPETDDNVLTWNTMDALLPSSGGRGGEPGAGPDMAGRGALPEADRAAGRGAGNRGGNQTGTAAANPNQAQQQNQTQPQNQQRPQQQAPQPRSTVIPIFKLMTPTGLATEIIKN
jgi:hypothetical protein